MRGHLAESRRWCDVGLTLAPRLPPALEARVWLHDASLAWRMGDNGEREPRRHARSELFRQVGDRYHEAGVSTLASIAAGEAGDHADADSLAEEARTIYAELGDRRRVAMIDHNLGLWALDRGDWPRARAYLEAGLAGAREIGSDQLTGNSLVDLGVLALYEGREDDAVRLFAEGLESARRTGWQINIAYCLRGLGSIAAARGDAETAARLFGAAEGVEERAGEQIQSYARRAFDQRSCAGPRAPRGAGNRSGVGGRSSDERGRRGLVRARDGRRTGASLEVPLEAGPVEPIASERDRYAVRCKTWRTVDAYHFAPPEPEPNRSPHRNPVFSSRSVALAYAYDPATAPNDEPDKRVRVDQARR